ncbi:major intrinsically disordered Notch2-binding receptor 1 [Gadus morhua]|uniref:major intrinsically disordered Notch2-binding receptor 1 n=1 Tax=Gadus morhua TaxID=8049 RepID=UPI0011B45DE6|nr:major intrinsically disordered Notch2-binding receptor 1-like [Gadus morhua]
MANLQQEYPLVLLGILEELANMRHWLSFQDLCRMVSTRFDLEHLVELRSLLFAAASQDPCFPATLFRDRVAVRNLGLSPIGVAADIVTIFNLIQMTSGAYDGNQSTRSEAAIPIDQSLGPSELLSFTGRERARSHSDIGSKPIDQHLLFPKSNYSAYKRGSLPPDPISLVSSPPARARAVSFSLPHNSPLFAGDQFTSQDMQNMYLPLETDSESSGESVPPEVFEEEQESAVDQKRNIFKKDFHNQPPLIPQVTISSESLSPGQVPKSFDNLSFEMLNNPYPSPTAVQHLPEQQVKHESLDDLQDSTYFGPRSKAEWSPRHLQPPRTQKSMWTNKSHSLEDRVGVGSMGLGLEASGAPFPRRSSPAISLLGASLAGEFRNSLMVDRGDGAKAQGTQTDAPDHRRLRSMVHADRLSFMTSLDDPEFGEDDISAIFRFLDDMSMCGSTGVLHPSEGMAAANPDTHEGRRGRLGQLQRLFHSLESTDDGGLKASVCKLLLRMSQIERQLEGLAEVKSEISQVLSALQRLDEKIQQPVVGGGRGTGGGRWLEPLSAGVSSFSSHPVTPGSETSEPQPLSVSGLLYPRTSSSSLDWSRWNAGGPMESGTDQAEVSKGSKEGKKEASSRRASRAHAEEKAVSDAKRPSVSHSAREWAVAFSKGKDHKSSSYEKGGQVDQTNNSTTNLLSQKPPTLVEQVFNSGLFKQKDSSLMGGMSSGKVMESRLAGGRGRPIWALHDRESPVSPLNMQGQESLNPTNMDFWMEDTYTPGYDALLRRKEAHLRRARACKLGALIIISIIIILVIVIPVCTMGIKKS